jgi:hypothetical protein
LDGLAGRLLEVEKNFSTLYPFFECRFPLGLSSTLKIVFISDNWEKPFKCDLLTAGKSNCMVLFGIFRLPRHSKQVVDGKYEEIQDSWMCQSIAEKGNSHSISHFL